MINFFHPLRFIAGFAAVIMLAAPLAAQTNPPPSAGTGVFPAGNPPAASALAPGPGSPAVQAGQPGTFVNFNFDQVEIKFLVKLVGELTGKKFVIDKEIDGKVTVITPPQIPLGEVYPLFLSILEAGGCAVVEQDGISHVVARERRQTPIAPVIGAGEKNIHSGMITRVFRITHLNASEIKKILEPMVDQGKTGAIGLLESTNHLIITDTADNLRRIEQLIMQIDKPGMARVIEVYRLRYAIAAQMAGELNQAMAGSSPAKPETAGDRIRQRLPRPADSSSTPVPGDAIIVAAPHSNSLILVGTPAQLADIKRIIASMDVEPKSGHGHLKAIHLKYLAADEAAKSLTALLARGVDKPQNQTIAIEASLANNALMIDAAPQDFEMVKQLIDELDNPPQQVLVEVMIAELTLAKGKELGAEFMAAGTPSEGSTIALGGMNPTESDSDLMSRVMSGVVPKGLTFGIAKGSYVDADGNVVARIPALLNIVALKSKGKMKILSNLPLWTQNNQQATVTIGKNIPVLKSTVAGGSGTSRDYIENIERLDVGIKLTVTPHVNPNNEILMKLNPSIEAVIEQTTDGKAFTPTIAKREVTTAITVPDGDTVIISGLIREDNIASETKIPILGSIPLLGYLFRYTKEEIERTNLLIFVTPHATTNALKRAELDQEITSRTALEGMQPEKPVEDE
ncbi:MAG: type II secretion system secretin GspD [Kiritimatiellae bacterium]|nr:type II secretion system secretin GspD [Kiritimatiellia bacterium]